ncbi:MAG: MMPL family transporter [Comamonas sp.]|uniref:efflux RND transporter permease subunit n=1 Tax=Comamonas sp. TaxID=34028 RepID=UPI002FC82F11
MMPSSSPVPTAARFDTRSGSVVERLLFNHRLLVVVLCALVTLVLGWQATRLQLQASFEKTIPTGHPYIANYLAHQTELSGLGNAVRIAVARPQGPEGGIYDAAYLDTLRRLTDAVFLLPGVDRVAMKSLWTPTTRWFGVTEDGLEGGPVIPDGFDGGQASLQQLAANVARSGEIGQLVARDARSSVIFVPLLAKDAEGKAIDYARLSEQLEALRSQFEREGVTIHITGFAKLVGDLIDGVRAVLLFFALAVAIATAMVYWYTRCLRSTLLVVLASLIAVVWQLGLLPLLGFVLDPYSILVPFLVFAIGMSHGAQKMNGIMQDIGRGADKLVAARFTFRRLFLAGLTALVADAVGFAVLLVIDIQAIRELAIAASLGVGVLIFTNLILLPILLSYTGVSARAAARSLRAEEGAAAGARLWTLLTRFTERRWAAAAVTAGLVLGVAGFAASTQLKIGDLDPGAPELREGSRYNRDVAYLNAAYGASSDMLAVMVRTPPGQCANYETLNKVDALEWQLRQLDGVESTNTLALLNRRVLAGLNEGNPKWYEFVPNQDMLNTATASAPRGLYNDACSLLTVYAYLRDHKADTLARVVAHVEAFARENNGPQSEFLLAAGSAGIEAATNIVVRDAWRQMLLLVYGAVVLLCLVTFRSWRAVVVAVLPLVITSLLAEALMVALGMGVKVATLPVIALGVGIGVDYALYILSVTLAELRRGQSLAAAYHRALLFTGKVVMLTGVTLAVGVITWVASPIKFQADMGLLLAFMFLWNMVGALVLLPALAHFLLKPALLPVSRPAAMPAPLLTPNY